jgi:hypothetical protein
MTTWLAQNTDHGTEVLPVNDLITHDGDDCVCIPTVEHVPRTRGGDSWLVVHHSLDGRERHEQ